ncbi:MAG: potassium channel family protein [Candidatus Geothermincolia bacterium]
MLGGIIVVILLGSLLVLHFEKPRNEGIQTYNDAIWLSFVTMTTVGYGDKVPVTPGGKATVVIMMVVGISLLTGFITTTATARAEKALRRAKGLDRSTNLHDHFVVCGWNQRGKYVVERLAAAAEDSKIPVALLCALDACPVENDYVFFYKGNPTSAVDQTRVDIQKARSVVLLADEISGGDPSDVDARTVLAALTANQLNPGVRLVAEVLEPANVQHMKNAGVGEVFDHNLLAGNLLAQSAMRYGMIEVVTALAQKDADAKIHRIPVEPQMVGKSWGQVAVELEQDKGYVMVGLRKADGTKYYDTDTILVENDEILVLTSKID